MIQSFMAHFLVRFFPKFDITKTLPRMRILLTFLLIPLGIFSVKSQSIVGTWQLTSQTSCLDVSLAEDDDAETDEEDDLVAEMKNMSDGGTNSVIRFKDNQTGAESIRMIDSRRSTKKNNFLYKLDDGNLYILDKKSRLLLGSYEIERLTSDSLIFTNARKACETRVFVRVKE